MQIDYDHSIGKPTKPDEVDDLLWGRMKIMGLDVDAIGREFREVFDNARRRRSFSKHSVSPTNPGGRLLRIWMKFVNKP